MLDSRFYKILDEVTAIVILNFLFLLSSLLIITIFPALFAMISTVRNKFYYRSSEIFRLFLKELWKYKISANIIGIPATLSGFSIFYYVYAIFTMNTSWSLYLQPVSLLIFLMYLLFVFQAFFNFIHFKMTIKNWIGNSFLMIFYKPLLTSAFSVFVCLIFLISYRFQILVILGSFSLIVYGLVYQSFRKLPTLPMER